MNKSDGINELATALSKAQGEIKGALKDQSNPYFKSKYADLGSVVEAIRAPLAKYGLSYTQLTEPSEKDEVRVETVILHSSGQWISSLLALPVSKADAQGFGSALTYARRYGLSAAFGVAPEDDDGNAAVESAKKIVREPITPTTGARDRMTPEQMKRINDVASSVTDCIAADNIVAACEVIDDAGLDADEKVCLWTFFDSKERRALKDAAKERHTAKMKELEPSQA